MNTQETSGLLEQSLADYVKPSRNALVARWTDELDQLRATKAKKNKRARKARRRNRK